MKKQTLRISQITLSILMATTLATKANDCQVITPASAIEIGTKQVSHRLIELARAIRAQFKLRLNPWCQDFIKSDKQYLVLVQELDGHIKSFEDEVIVPHLQATSASDELTRQTHGLVTDLQTMSKQIHKELQGLIGQQKPTTYIAVISASKKNMDKQVSTVFAKLHKIKASCKAQKETELLQEIHAIETDILTFKKQHENAELAVFNQIKRWVAQRVASTF